MIRRDFVRASVAAGVTGIGAGAAAAFPSRPITVVVPFGPGGIADLTARAIGQAMAPLLGQPVVVDNRPGAGSIVASQAVASAAPDGHTLLLMSNAHAVAAGLFRRLPYDAAREFAPIALLAGFDLALFVDAKSRWRDLGEWLAHARGKPGAATLGTISVGSTQHLAGKLIEHRAGVDALMVPYKGTPALLGALRGGEVECAVEILGPWLPQVAAGTLRALAVCAPQRFGALATTPTLREAGIADAEVSSWNALAAPARTPPEVVARLNDAVDAALRQPAVQAQLQALGARALGGTPDRLRAHLAAETRRWGEVIRLAKITPE